MDVLEPAGADELYRWRADYALVGQPALPLAPDELARIGFRVRLASPGTRIVVRCGAVPAEAEALVAAGADGILLDGPDVAAGTADTSVAFRAVIDAALAKRDRA